MGDEEEVDGRDEAAQATRVGRVGSVEEAVCTRFTSFCHVFATRIKSDPVSSNVVPVGHFAVCGAADAGGYVGGSSNSRAVLSRLLQSLDLAGARHACRPTGLVTLSILPHHNVPPSGPGQSRCLQQTSAQA